MATKATVICDVCEQVMDPRDCLYIDGKAVQYSVNSAYMAPTDTLIEDICSRCVVERAGLGPGNSYTKGGAVWCSVDTLEAVKQYINAYLAEEARPSYYARGRDLIIGINSAIAGETVSTGQESIPLLMDARRLIICLLDGDITQIERNKARDVLTDLTTAIERAAN